MKVPEPRKLSSGMYFIQLRLNGVSVSITEPTPKKCKQQAALIKAEHLSGVREIRRAASDPTLKQALERYIDSKRNILSPSTICGYTSVKNNRLTAWQDVKIHSIKDWQSIMDAEAKVVSPKTLKNIWRLVRSTLAFCGMTPPKIALPQVVTDEHPFLTPTQIPEFVSLVKDQPCAIPALLALHSLRRSEIAGLTWDNIDLKNELIYIRGSAVYDENHELVHKASNKNKASRRTVPIMIPELLAALKAVEDKHGSVMTCSPNTPYSQINKLCERSGLPMVGIHGLRHSFASLGFHLRLSEREVMELGGWSDPQTVHKIYEHLAQQDRLKAENKMKQFYKNANENANKASNTLNNHMV